MGDGADGGLNGLGCSTASRGLESVALRCVVSSIFLTSGLGMTGLGLGITLGFIASGGGGFSAFGAAGSTVFAFAGGDVSVTVMVCKGSVFRESETGKTYRSAQKIRWARMEKKRAKAHRLPGWSFR